MSRLFIDFVQTINPWFPLERETWRPPNDFLVESFPFNWRLFRMFKYIVHMYSVMPYVWISMSLITGKNTNPNYFIPVGRSLCWLVFPYTILRLSDSPFWVGPERQVLAEPERLVRKEGRPILHTPSWERPYLTILDVSWSSLLKKYRTKMRLSPPPLPISL